MPANQVPIDVPGRFPDDQGATPATSLVGPGAPSRGPHASALRVNVYIDGFNLYFGCLQGTPYRWLDVSALSRRHLLDPLFPSYTINQLRYFTARVQDPSGRSEGSLRQDVYLRALSTIPNLSVHQGQFKTNKRSYPLADGSGQFAEILRSEEKGSDVNLATYLAIDAFDGCFDVALVISNDTDLVLPVRLIRERLAVAIGVAAPCYFRNRRPMRELEEVADFTAHIRKAQKECLRASQFPQTVPLADGKLIICPDRWRPTVDTPPFD